MHKPQEQVREFHRAINQPTSPAKPEIRTARLAAQLIVEEAIETAFALVGAADACGIVEAQLSKAIDSATCNPDLCQAIDGLCDTIFVCYGAAERIGIDLEPFFDAVHAANMKKLDGPVDPQTGKKLKPPGWSAPDLASILARQVQS